MGDVVCCFEVFVVGEVVSEECLGLYFVGWMVEMFDEFDVFVGKGDLLVGYYLFLLIVMRCLCVWKRR